MLRASLDLRLRQLSACAVVVVLIATACSVVAAAPQDRRAIYHGSKFGIDVDYEVRIKWQAADAPALQWMRLPGDDRINSRGIEGGAQWVHISLERRILGAAVISDSLLDPQQDLTTQRIVQRQRNGYVSYKATQFGSDGIRLLRVRKDDAECCVNWSEARSSYRLFADWSSDGDGISDPNSLFYLVGTETLQRPGAELGLRLFSDNQLLQVKLRVRDSINTEVALVESVGGAERRIDGSREGLRITIDASHLDPDVREEDLSVLGMQGAIEMLVDRDWGVPLSISGRVPKFGEVRLDLQRVEL